MVCDKCEKKLTKLVVPDVITGDHKEDVSRPTVRRTIAKTTSSKLKRRTAVKQTPKSVRATTSKQRVLNENKLLTSKREQRPEKGPKCRLCRHHIQVGHHYCPYCAYRKGICSMCGKKVLDTSGYKQSI